MNTIKKAVALIKKFEFGITHIDRMLVSGIFTIVLGLLIFLYYFEPDLARFLLDISQLVLILYVWANLKGPFST